MKNKLDGKISFVWTRYGNDVAFGMRVLSPELNQPLIERIYNLFFNYEITNGSLVSMNEGRFGYFLIPEERMPRLKSTKNETLNEIRAILKKDFTREDFLRQYTLQRSLDGAE